MKRLNAHFEGRWRKRAFSLGLLLFMLVVSATAADAASSGFSINVPNFGSKTGGTQYTTVDNNHRIDIKYSSNPADSQIKAVRCSDGTDISGYKFVAAGNHTLQTLVNSVVHGTCFKINIDTPQCCNSYTFQGTVYY
jgi:hypothetical protein